MRLTDPKSLFAFLLFALPVWVAWAGWGVPAAIAVSVAAALLGVWLRLRATLKPSATRPQLHTISYSHYVEKVRWCLDRAGVDYEEVPDVGILGVLLLGRTVPTLELSLSRTSVGNSAEILRLMWGLHGHEHAGRAEFLRPTEEAIVLERHLDEALGEQVRRWAYQRLFEHPALTLQLWGAYEPAVPAWQKALLPVLRPVLQQAVRSMLRITPSGAARALERTTAVFDEIDARLADGRRYLLGDTIGFVDITFASLGALAVLPDNYGGGRLVTKFPPVESLDPAWRDEVLALRQRPAGQFILRLYREDRLAPQSG